MRRTPTLAAFHHENLGFITKYLIGYPVFITDLFNIPSLIGCANKTATQTS